MTAFVIAIILFIVAHAFYRLDRKRDKYPPPRFKGSWINYGIDYNEKWRYKVPAYSKRYVNVIEKEENTYIILSRYKYKDAIEVDECDSQQDADIIIGLFQKFYPDSKLKLEDKPLYINVYRSDSGLITVRRSYEEDMVAYETIKCMDMEECDELIDRVERHYEKYDTVFVSMLMG